MIYRLLLITTIVVFFVFIFRGVSFTKLFKQLLRNSGSIFSLVSKDSRKNNSIFSTVRIISLNLTILFFILLMISAFPPVILGYKLSGILLIIHVTIAPFFVVLLTITVLLWAHKMQFDTLKSSDNVVKLCFWIFIILSLPAILSIIIGMFPIFGMDAQYYLIELHKYSTLLLFIVLSVFILFKSTENKNVTEEK